MVRIILRSDAFPEGGIAIESCDLPVTLGRSHRADITINDSLLSRVHAELRLLPDGEIHIVDNESTNLTIVNEHDISDVVLRTGDVILLGETEIQVEIESGRIGLHDRTTREIPRFDPDAGPDDHDTTGSGNP